MGAGSSVESKARTFASVLACKEKLLALRSTTKTPPPLQRQQTFTDNNFSLALPQKVTSDLEAGVRIEWLRPCEIVSKGACLFGPRGPSPEDVWQGELGDCYLLTALVSVAARAPGGIRALFGAAGDTDSLVAHGQYDVRFWANGKWCATSIDDRLPCVVTPNGVRRPLFCKQASLAKHQQAELANGPPQPFWAPLLEKAYAKCFGRGVYENIVPGKLSDAIIDVTGSQVVQRLNPGQEARGVGTFGATLFKAPDDAEAAKGKRKKRRAPSLAELQTSFFEVARRAHASGDVLAASAGKNATKAHGLLPCHAYALLRVCELAEEVEDGDATPVRLLQLRNPWGSFEWNGAWADGSQEWTAARRSALGHVDAEDGCFWMELGDFWRFFESILVCRALDRSLPCAASAQVSSWHVQRLHGEWDAAHAGGSKGAAFGKNRVYALSFEDAADASNAVNAPPSGASGGAELEAASAPVRVYVTLSNPALPERQGYLEQDRIGLVLGRMDTPFHPLLPTPDYLRDQAWLPLTIDRDLTWEGALTPLPNGEPHLLVPVTQAAGKLGSYMLTIHSERPLCVRDVSELKGGPLFTRMVERMPRAPPLHGEWAVEARSAGGSQGRSFEAWLRNPQYLMRVPANVRCFIGIEVRGCKGGAKTPPLAEVDVCKGVAKAAATLSTRIEDSSGFELEDVYEPSWEAEGCKWREFRLTALKSGEPRTYVLVPHLDRADVEASFTVRIVCDCCALEATLLQPRVGSATTSGKGGGGSKKKASKSGP